MSKINASQFFNKGTQHIASQSLRFEDGDSPSFSFTFDTPTNQRKWTMSFWCKRGEIGREHAIYGAANGGGETFFVAFYPDDIEAYISSGRNHVTNAVFRDPSAWYHIVQVFDSANATADDRFITYVNGVRQTTSTNSVALNDTTGWNTSGVTGYFGKNYGAWFGDSRDHFDGYLANVAFIDGQALTPTSFGEYDDTLWKPKSDRDIQALTFGTNGFYLPFKQTTQAEGFSTVTWTGNDVDGHGIEGVGFSPDFVWIKNRDVAENHNLYDTIRGAGQQLYSDTSDEEFNRGTLALQSFDSNGFSLGVGGEANDTNEDYVAWCWDAGKGSAVSNADGSITSSVKANTANGFSIVSYTGNGTSGATIGHGLSQAPDMIIPKNRDADTNWWVHHSSLSNAGGYLVLNSNAAEADAVAVYNQTNPTSSVFTVGNENGTNKSGSDMIAYCFHSVSGYSDFGSFSGTGSAGNAVTTGFEPAFVMIKRTDLTDNWIIHDNTRDPSQPTTRGLYPNLTSTELTGNNIEFTSTGFTLQTTDNGYNGSGGTYIYMAFADTRDATFFGDTSGNSNNWTPNALNNTDVVPDAPVTGGNFATLNPIDKVGVSLSEGNLKSTATASSWQAVRSTITYPSGSWYVEVRSDAGTGNGNSFVGITRVSDALSTMTGSNLVGSATTAWAYSSNGNIYNSNAVDTATGTTWSAGSIIGMTFDGSSVKFYKDNSLVHTESGLTGDYVLSLGSYSTDAMTANFGQDSSFAGNETPQGNTDDGGVGEFYYTPPSGFLALTTGNLPPVTITAPDNYFNTVLYTGTGSSLSVTGTNFQPDWTWIKKRSASENHALYDVVRGTTNRLQSNATTAENTGGLTSFDSDGFTVDGAYGTDGENGATYAAWNWLAGGTAVSNTDGSITSSVSANQDAGFSIISYRGNGTSGATFGHGLGKTPSHFIIKRYSTSEAWVNWHTTFSATQYIRLYQSQPINTATNIWNSTLPSSSVVTIGNGGYVNTSGEDYICYAFSEIDGYSKFGSYTGNGLTDGTFVHCGFRPAWVMLKAATGAAQHWWMFDNKREGYNVDNDPVYANLSSAEGTSDILDFTSNGFKIRNSSAVANGSGQTFIFMAFAEAPFKSANAR